MTEIESTIHRDLRLSYLIAPLRYIAPILGYIALYPIIIRNYGMEVLGLWGLLAAIPQALTSMDMGFSLILTREVGGQGAEELPKVYRKYRTAKKIIRLFIPILVFLAVTVVFFGNLPAVEYRPAAIKWAVIIMVLAVIVQRLAALDIAILNGRGDNYFVHFVAAFSPVVFLGISIAGALSGAPLECLSVGFLVANCVSWLAYKIRTRDRHSDWHRLHSAEYSSVSLKECFSLVRSGAYLYAASLGMILRDPVLRYTIGILLGLESAAIYEVAIRVGRTGREIIASGFSALFPSIATLIRNSSTGQIEIITRESLFLLIVAGGSVLGGVFVIIPWLFDLWLGTINAGLVEATRIVCVWSAITLCNTPFWYQLIAGRGEKEAARAIWLHTFSIIGLFPLVQILDVEIGLNAVLLYWLAGSIGTQLAIYYHAQKRFGLVVPVFKTPRIWTAILGLTMSVTLLTHLSDNGTMSHLVAAAIFTTVVFLGLFASRSHLDYWLRRRTSI